MTRLETAFSRSPAFMPYYPLGFPTPEVSVDVIEALAKNGADLIEVGLPFSDPLADGPVIQRATQIALEQGMTVKKALAAVRELRARGVTIPLILMGYYNPMLAYGLEKLAAEASTSGADGFIVPDLPPEESADFETAVAPLPQIRMVAPTTPEARLGTVLSGARGFVYMVSLTGVTGTRTALPEGLPEFVSRVKTHTAVPVCVGFGISTPEQARAVGQLADGVIVGSACVRTIGESATPVQTAAEFARGFAGALRGE
ncbi:MAG: tryptophan synthase subunit alpha [Anaerolineales bacterium]|nr:tryptophan synthase subunit alpha [Anaerolineales bacterium]